MSVVNGQIANQTTFNNAFMSRTSPGTSTVAIVALNNAEVVSGASVSNIQRAINKAFEGVGATGEADAAINDYSSNNYVSNGDNRKVAVGKLDTQLKTTQDQVDDVAGDIASIDARVLAIESEASTFGGDKTFSDNVTIQGNLLVTGTTTSINSTELEVEDAYITINKGGTDVTAENAGIEIERDTDNAALQFDSTLESKWKIGVLSAMYEIIVSGIAQTVDGLKDFIGGIKTDTVAESTTDAGVTVDGVLIKDGLVDNVDVAALETRVDDTETDIASIDGRVTTLESGNTTISGNKTFSGDSVFKNTRVTEEIFMSSIANAQTGADVQLTPITAPIVRLTGALTSVNRIDAPSTYNKDLIIINQTGGNVVFKNNVGSPASARIMTGTGSDVSIPNNKAFKATYDVVTQLWYLHSAEAGGGSAVWGAITGTLSDQTDLQAALDNKAPVQEFFEAEYTSDYFSTSPSVDTWDIPDTAFSITLDPGQYKMQLIGLMHAQATAVVGNQIVPELQLGTSTTPGSGLVGKLFATHLACYSSNNFDFDPFTGEMGILTVASTTTYYVNMRYRGFSGVPTINFLGLYSTNPGPGMNPRIIAHRFAD